MNVLDLPVTHGHISPADLLVRSLLRYRHTVIFHSYAWAGQVAARLICRRLSGNLSAQHVVDCS